jgi:phenylacetate-CoA ligase
MEEFRDARIREMVQHCARSVPYYRRLFAETGFRADRCAGLCDLAPLPILTKETVQARTAEFISGAVDSRRCQMTHTSGTTGAGLRFPVTLRAMRESWAVWWRYRRLHGIQLNTWCAYFGGRTVVPPSQRRAPFWRTNRHGRQVMFSGYHISPANLPAYIDHLNRRRLEWIHGYPSLVALLAGHLLDTGRRLDYQVRWITLGAENLLPLQSQLIEEAFAVRPIQHYGMTEAVANISEHPDGHLYVDEDFAAVEFVPNDAGSFSIVGTNLTNIAFPLLRYSVADDVQLPEKVDPNAGLFPGRRVLAIDGRKEDYVVLRNGARLGRMDHIFKDMVAVREAQIVQQKPGELIARIVRRPNYSEADAARLRREFKARLGDQAEVAFEYVDSIPKTATGKIRFVVSNLKQGQIAP